MISFRNPSPPPGHMLSSSVEIVKKSHILDGITELLLESGIFDSTDNYDEFIIMTSEDEIEVPAIVVKEEPKSPEPTEVDTTLSEDLRQKVKIESTSPKLKEKKNYSKDKEKKSKKKKRDRSSSSSSGDSRISRHSKVETKPRRKSKSSSDDKSDYEEKKIKIEKIKTEKIKTEDIKTEILGADMLHGSYYCDICKASMNSYGTFQTHINGKRHLKNIKLRNTAEVVSKTIAPTNVESRYPPPLPGIYRMKTVDPSKIQHIVEKLKSPCPGLHKVIEIQGIEETTYYCELCDAPCTAVTIVPHLQGHKHQLRCVRLYEPEIYESYRYKKKHEIDKRILSILREAEKRYGRGEIKVEREYEARNLPSSAKLKGSYSSRSDMPGPSYVDPEDAFPEHYSLTTIPDTSKSDFYCKLCDSHMNSEQMWEAHIRGKRHLTNAKKAPGEAPSKTKSVLLPHARAKIMDELDQVYEPIVGLDEMRETQNPDAPGEMYNCFLCGACMTTIDFVDHVLSQKHRTKYLEKIKHPDMLLLQDINIQESKVSTIVEEICGQVESERGRGHLEVHVMRSIFNDETNRNQLKIQYLQYQDKFSKRRSRGIKSQLNRLRKKRLALIRGKNASLGDFRKKKHLVLSHRREERNKPK